MRPLPFPRLLAAACMAAGLVSGPAYGSGFEGMQQSAFAPEYQVSPAELDRYAAGELGVVQPSYWRLYLFLAYRALQGTPVGKERAAALGIDTWKIHGTQDATSIAVHDEAVKSWLDARRAVPGVGPDPKIETNRAVDEKEGWPQFLNCPADAFKTAIATLADRRKTRGDPAALDWIAGQDAVFAQCGSSRQPPPLPAAAPSNAAPWLKADRAYQQAAALFYAKRYMEARTAFQTIAKDSASPWRSTAQHVAIRALVRQATIQPPAKQPVDLALLKQARGEAAGLAKHSPQARQLIDWIDVRLRPSERLAELGRLLSAKDLPADFEQALADYLVLMDQHFEQGLLTSSTVLDPMTQWIQVMQSGSKLGDTPAKRDATLPTPFATAAARWQKERSEPWLIAALTHAEAKDADAALLQAATSVKPSSAGFVAAQYHQARLLLAQGKAAEAGKVIDTLLGKHAAIVPVSARNGLAALKLRAADSMEAFLAAAPRTPIFDSGYRPANRDGAGADKNPQTYDEDAIGLINWKLPVAAQKKLLEHGSLLPSMKKPLADAVWTRAVLLGDFAIADAVVDAVGKSRGKATATLLAKYQGATDPIAKKAAAAVVLINTPELHPFVVPPRSYYSSYWWCQLEGKQADMGDITAVPDARFLPTAEQNAAAIEVGRLGKLTNGTDYLAGILLSWARANPNDPQVPEALHRLVAATRGGCISKQTSAYSKEAFQLLHKQYPKSEWAKRTRYHY